MSEVTRPTAAPASQPLATALAKPKTVRLNLFYGHFQSLYDVSLWDEVKDKLHQSAYGLSGWQKQRLCISRTLAVDPEVLLLDEPCSALDPIATAKVEDLLFSLRDHRTQVSVKYKMQQPARVAESTGSSYWGD